MCIGIPMRVLESDGVTALCEGRGERCRLNVLMLENCPPGAWVLSFQGIARQLLDAGEAARIDAALDAVEAALRGETDLDGYFPDLLAPAG